MCVIFTYIKWSVAYLLTSQRGKNAMAPVEAALSCLWIEEVLENNAITSPVAGKCVRDYNKRRARREATLAAQQKHMATKDWNIYCYSCSELCLTCLHKGLLEAKNEFTKQLLMQLWRTCGNNLGCPCLLAVTKSLKWQWRYTQQVLLSSLCKTFWELWFVCFTG